MFRQILCTLFKYLHNELIVQLDLLKWIATEFAFSRIRSRCV